MNRRSGYSILEVLIAFAVMSMTLAILLPGQTLLLGRASTAADRALAHDYALSRLEEISVLGAGVGAETYGNWQIEQAISEIANQRRVTVIVLSAAGWELAAVTRTYGVADAE